MSSFTHLPDEKSKFEKIMTGIFNKRSPKPNYVFIWVVEVVLKSLNDLFPKQLLSLKV